MTPHDFLLLVGASLGAVASVVMLLALKGVR